MINGKIQFRIRLSTYEKSVSPPQGGVSFAKLFLDTGAFTGRLSRSLVNNETEVANLSVFGGVGAVLAALVHPVGWDDNVEGVLDYAHLQRAIDFSRSSQGWGRVHLDQPWLQRLVYQHIEAVDLKAMLVVDDHALHRLQRDVDDVSDSFKALISDFFATSLFEVEL